MASVSTKAKAASDVEQRAAAAGGSASRERGGAQVRRDGGHGMQQECAVTVARVHRGGDGGRGRQRLTWEREGHGSGSGATRGEEDGDDALAW